MATMNQEALLLRNFHLHQQEQLEHNTKETTSSSLLNPDGKGMIRNEKDNF